MSNTRFIHVVFEWDSQKAATNLRKHKVRLSWLANRFSIRLYAISTMRLLAVNFEKELSG